MSFFVLIHHVAQRIIGWRADCVGLVTGSRRGRVAFGARAWI